MDKPKEPCTHQVSREYMEKHRKIKMKKGKAYFILPCPNCNLIAIACSGNTHDNRTLVS